MTMAFHTRRTSFYAKDMVSGKAFAYDPVTECLKEYSSEPECWKAIDNFNGRTK